MMKSFYLTVFVLLFSVSLISQEVLEWRGAGRTGIYPENNLLKKWPDAGPNLVWEFNILGNGYSSPAITSKNIYITGEIDTLNYLFALDLQGKMLWKSKIGKEWVTSYPGSRSTPTVVGDLIYITAGCGTVSCFEATTGKEKWTVDMIDDFHAPINTFGFSESVVVDDDKVFCTPGSKDTNVVALDRFSGQIKWICKGLGGKAAYCSPLLIKLPLRNILVTFTAHELLGIDTKDGKLLWSQKQDSEGDVHVNTPYFENGFIYYITGDGNGSVKLKLSEDGTQINEVWRSKTCDNTIGSFIKMNDYIYSSGYEKRMWYSMDANTGQVTDSLKFDRGNTIAAEGLLYFYNEKGQLGLVRPNGPKMEIISSFKITHGTKAHYAHPVINKGILYVRHGKSLLAYYIKG
jgi:outer membrane protein assembly factor BamB